MSNLVKKQLAELINALAENSPISPYEIKQFIHFYSLTC